MCSSTAPRESLMGNEIGRASLSCTDILLNDRVAFVTGGGGGIGRGIATGLAAFGADIVIVDIDCDAAERVATIVRGKGRRALIIKADVMNRDAMRAAVDQTVSDFGALDILVNNAGGTRPLRLIEMTDRQVDRQIDINLKSLIATTQAAARAMIRGGRGGAVINIASIEGFRAAPGFAVYAACKAGMLNFTRSSALELAEYGIRVNAIAPDIVPTEAMIRFAPDVGSEQGRAAQARYIPLGRAGTPDDCAGAAIFLASAMANYITGVTVNVDGGTWASSGWTRREGADWTLFG